MTPSSTISIFQELKRDMGDAITTVTLTKATLVHMSHTLEDFVLKRQLPALIFTGFQESSHWRSETERYQQLADTALQVCIFAGEPLPDDGNLSAVQITLDGEDPLRQEWFLAIFSTDFTVILAGLDNMEAVYEEPHRRFETIWSFDMGVVNQVLDTLERVIEYYRPDVLATLREARRDYPPVEPQSELVVQFTRELLRFEDRLQRQVHEKAQELQISQARYQSVIARAPIALISISNNGIVQVVEDNKPRTIFAGTGVAAGGPLSALSEAIPAIVDYFHRTLVGDVIHDVIDINDGVFEVYTRAVRGENERPQSVIIVLIDITERSRIEQSSAEQERLLFSLEKEREVNELRRQLMVTLSHELRTPMASIRTSSDLLLRYFSRLSEQDRRQRLVNIQNQVAHLTSIMDDIDAVVRQENAPFGEDIELLDIAAVVRQVSDEVQDATGRGFTYDFEANLGNMRFDRRLIQYVVSNLLTNAVKYSEPETEIVCALKSASDYLQICVSDRGIGIPESDIPRVFEPFYRAGNVGVVGGTGLGLSIIQNALKSLGGSLDIQSTVGVGTTATVSLPVIGPSS